MSNWEEALIAAVLKDGDIMVHAECISPGDFISESHKEVWKVMSEINKSGKITPTIVIETMREHNTLDQIGNGKIRGEAYIRNMADTGDPVSIYDIVEHVEGSSIKRQIGNLAALMSLDSKNGKSPEEIIATYTQRLISMRRKKSTQAYTMADLIGEFDTRFQKLRNNDLSGITWHSRIPAIREIVRYADEGDFIIIPGTTAMGKSTYLRYEAFQTALDHHGVLVLNYENSPAWFINSALSMLTGIENTRIKWPASLTDKEIQSIEEAKNKVMHMPLYIKNMGVSSVDDAVATIRSEVAKHPDIHLVQVDYLQLIRGATKSKYEDVSEAAQILRSLALEIGVPIMVASQVKRESYRVRNSIPQKTDLLYAGEQQAKCIIAPYPQELSDQQAMMFNDNVINGDFIGIDKLRVDVIRFAVIKNSNGSEGITREVAYYKHLNDFRELPADWRKNNFKF